MNNNVKDWKWRIFKSGHNQASFSKLAGIHESQLSEWIRGDKEPRKNTREKIEKHLKDLGV